jgi:hypothetical protein
MPSSHDRKKARPRAKNATGQSAGIAAADPATSTPTPVIVLRLRPSGSGNPALVRHIVRKYGLRKTRDELSHRGCLTVLRDGALTPAALAALLKHCDQVNSAA